MLRVNRRSGECGQKEAMKETIYSYIKLDALKLDPTERSFRIPAEWLFDFAS